MVVDRPRSHREDRTHYYDRDGCRSSGTFMTNVIIMEDFYDVRSKRIFTMRLEIVPDRPRFLLAKDDRRSHQGPFWKIGNHPQFDRGRIPMNSFSVHQR